MKTLSERNVAILQMLICATLWSIAGIFIKLIPWSPFVISGARSAVAGIVVFAYIKLKKLPVITNRKTLISGLIMCFVYTCFVVANKLTTAANAIVLQFTAPVFIMVFSALLFKQKFSRADLLAVVFTLAGISLFFLDQLTPGHLLGNIVGIFAGMFMAGMYITIGNADSTERMSCVFFGQVMTALVSVPFIFITKPQVAAVPLLSILILGVFQLGIPYILFVKAAEHCPPLACSLLGAMEPLLNPVWVAIFDGEKPGIFALFGGIIVVATVTLWCVFGNKNSQTSS
ncbi:MAG: DMT family transporter [Oscillospiraceae bacterium]